MKYSLFLYLAILLSACHTKTIIAKKNQPVQADTTHTNNEEDSFDYNIMIKGDSALPKGFAVDSVSFQDSRLQITADLMYAYPPSLSAYKQLVARTIDTAFKEFKTSIEKSIKESTAETLSLSEDEYTQFSVEPLNFYQDDNIVSLRFIISMYTPGAAHAISELRSVNFDKRTSKLFKANDFFTFKTSEDSSLLIKIFNRRFDNLEENLAEGNPWKFYNISDIDFNLTGDTICFNFSDYALGQGPSMMNYKVSKKELVSIINPQYR
ncbi:hypothetical protein GO495_31025 [Chitinophaga oryziterrae]|uniref:DUF3298 domain-containing protein n=1 Tax=Chitinophaga oryziterrae TaxID=1031224 RepID=A0A6N8JKW5_9BACT|nr:hypothetical protein [Chitinophaga oryziterrae]MVT45061.1 hypothetical protein [Chitinophaga oryziterrae]